MMARAFDRLLVSRTSPRFEMRLLPMVIALLVGCTGGPYYTSVDAPPTGEGFPPVVTSTDPADGAVDLATAVEIRIAFSEPMDPSTVTAESVRLLGTDGMPFSATATTSGNEVTLVPATRLNPDATYRVEIADTVRDIEGDAMEAPYAFEFGTSGGWEDPVRFAMTEKPVYLAADSSNGHAVVLWVVGACDGGCAGDYTLYASTYSSDGRDGEFGSRETVAALSTNPITSIAVTIDHEGAATAVWTQTAGTYRSVFASRREPGGGWSAPGLIETENLGHATAVKADVTDGGVVHVVWEQRNGSTPNIWTNRYVPGLGWATASLLETSDTAASRPAIVTRADDTAIAVWNQGKNIGFSRFSGTAWANAFFPGTGNDFRLVRLADDRVLLAWLEGPVAVSLYDGAGWTTPSPLGAGTDEALSYGFAATRAGDGATVVWTEGSLLPQASVYQARFDGVSWGSTGEIENLSGGTLFVDAASSRDRAMVVWEQTTPAADVVYAVEYRAPEEWRTPEPVSDSSIDSETPLVLYDGGSNIFLAIWVQDDGLYWNRYQ